MSEKTYVEKRKWLFGLYIVAVIIGCIAWPIILAAVFNSIFF